MTEEKVKRLTVSATVTAVVFLFILITVLVFQFVRLSALREREAKLNAEKARLIQNTQTVEEEIENRKTELAIEMEARKLGLAYPDDKKYK